MLTESYSINPVGIVHSCFSENFGIPRQSGLAKSANANIELLPPYNQQEIVRGLEEFSHIWLIFLFHKNIGKEKYPTVRPPRLGGNKRMGVFATRSPFRPNNIGLSVVKLESIRTEQAKIILTVSGIDLLDGTPVIDIKPYIPYADCLPDAIAGYAENIPEFSLQVEFTEPVAEILEGVESENPGFTRLIHDIIALDPRPAYHDEKIQRDYYAVSLNGFNVKWSIHANVACVTEIKRTA